MTDDVTAHKAETYRSLIEFSREGFKFLATLNGGTWLAVLTFAIKDAKTADLSRVRDGVVCLIVSMVLTALCFLGSWAAQFCLHNENHGRYPKGRHMIAVVITAIAYVAAALAYGLGAYFAMKGVIT